MKYVLAPLSRAPSPIVCALTCLLLACSGDREEGPAPTPAGTTVVDAHDLAPATEATWGEASEPRSVALELGAGGDESVKLSVALELGIATLTFADGSVARRRAPRSLTATLSAPTSRILRADCMPTLQSQGEDAQGLLFARCSFVLTGTGPTHFSIDFGGDGSVTSGIGADAIVATPSAPPLPALPGSPPGSVSQFLRESPTGGFELQIDAPGGDQRDHQRELPLPQTWRTRVTITLSRDKVRAIVGQLRTEGGEVNVDEEPERRVQASPITAAALAPLFEGIAGWPTPVAAFLKTPQNALHSDVIAILNAVRDAGIERTRIDVQAPEPADPDAPPRL